MGSAIEQKLGSFTASCPLLKHFLALAFMACGQDDCHSPLPGLLPIYCLQANKPIDPETIPSPLYLIMAQSPEQPRPLSPASGHSWGPLRPQCALTYSSAE